MRLKRGGQQTWPLDVRHAQHPPGCARDTGHAPLCETPTGDHTDSGRERGHNDEWLVRCQVVQLRHLDSTESRQRRESATVFARHARQGSRWGEHVSLAPSIEMEAALLAYTQEAFQWAKPRRNSSLQAQTVSVHTYDSLPSLSLSAGQAFPKTLHCHHTVHTQARLSTCALSSCTGLLLNLACTIRKLTNITALAG